MKWREYKFSLFRSRGDQRARYGPGKVGSCKIKWVENGLGSKTQPTLEIFLRKLSLSIVWECERQIVVGLETTTML